MAAGLASPTSTPFISSVAVACANPQGGGPTKRVRVTLTSAPTDRTTALAVAAVFQAQGSAPFAAAVAAQLAGGPDGQGWAPMEFTYSKQRWAPVCSPDLVGVPGLKACAGRLWIPQAQVRRVTLAADVQRGPLRALGSGEAGICFGGTRRAVHHVQDQQ